MNCLSNLRKIFGEDVSPENLQTKISELESKLENVLFHIDKKNYYPWFYIEVSVRLRLHLVNLQYNILPLHHHELFTECDLDLADIAKMAKLSRAWNNCFSAKEIPFGVGKSRGASSICVELNLDYPDMMLIEEVKNILRSTREQPLSKYDDICRRDLKDRVKIFPVDAAMKLLLDYEGFIVCTTNPTAAGKEKARLLGEESNEDTHARVMRKRNADFVKYLHWDDTFPEERNVEILSKEEEELLTKEEIKALKENS